jgi:hypothetical protein
MRLRRRGIIVLISDCHSDEGDAVSGIRHLAAKGHDVVVLQILDHDEIAFPFKALTAFLDLETGTELMCDPLSQRNEYRRRLQGFLDTVREGAQASGADYRFVDTAAPIEEVLREYLLYRRQRG